MNAPKRLELIDIGVNLAHKRFERDREEVIARAEAAGTSVRREKVVAVVRDGAMRVRTASGREDGFDLVVGADGVSSRMRAALSARLEAEDLSQAVGYYVPGRSDDVARLAFSPTLRGYLWSFPRVDHLAVGACAPLADGSAASCCTS